MGFTVLVALVLTVVYVPVCRSDDLSKISGILDKVGDITAKQSNNGGMLLGLVNSVQWQCLANCGLEFAKSMNTYHSLSGSGTKIITSPLKFKQQLDQGTADMTDQQRTEVYEQACFAQTDYAACVKRCPDDLIRQSIEAGMSSVDLICGELKDTYVAAIPCLSKNNELIRSRCVKESSRLTTASMIYHNPQIRNSPEKLLKAMRTFCLAYLEQYRCALPAVKELCGEKSADLFVSVMARSHESSLNFMTKNGLEIPSECQMALAQKLKLVPVIEHSVDTTTSAPKTFIEAPPIAEPLDRMDDFDLQSIQQDLSRARSTSTSAPANISTFVFVILSLCVLVYQL